MGQTGSYEAGRVAGLPSTSTSSSTASGSSRSEAGGASARGSTSSARSSAAEAPLVTKNRRDKDCDVGKGLHGLCSNDALCRPDRERSDAQARSLAATSPGRGPSKRETRQILEEDSESSDSELDGTIFHRVLPSCGVLHLLSSRVEPEIDAEAPSDFSRRFKPGEDTTRKLLWILLLVGVVIVFLIPVLSNFKKADHISTETEAIAVIPAATTLGPVLRPQTVLGVMPTSSVPPPHPPPEPYTVTKSTTPRPRPVCPQNATRFGPKEFDRSESFASRDKLREEGCYDLRVIKDGRLVGCAAPVNRFPGNEKYGCAGPYGTGITCDAADFPVKDTAFVWEVHAGCQTAKGKGTYGYAYDDGVGLKQCSPLTKYEWILCPNGDEGPIDWDVEPGQVEETKRRFRVRNKCSETVWVEQAGAPGAKLKGEEAILRMPSGAFHTYAIPDRGLASTRFIPKVGCNDEGLHCDVQSMPPCPRDQGCDLPVDTKFEASWGCAYALGNQNDSFVCELTGQGFSSTYQDWWDGSAVDGWTLPFSVLVDDGNRGLTAGSVGSPKICGDVICADLNLELCPRDEFLAP